MGRPLGVSALVAASLLAFDARGAEVLPSEIEIHRNADEYMTAKTAAGLFTGVVLIAREGEAIFAKGYGFANAEWRVPNGTKTKFRLGSITKQFTATLVMQLQQARKLSVQDAICKYLEPCPESWEPITIHHLLSHTSGIPSYTDDPSYVKDMGLAKTREDIVATFRDKPLEFTPGEEFRYSNSGYFLLGVIVERVAGKSYEGALKDMILAPLGMDDSGYDRHDTVLAQRASGYRPEGDGLANAEYLDMSWPYAAGAMYSTVEDLLKWDKALYEDVVLPRSALETMWTPNKGRYGYGWQIATPSPITANRSAVYHGGGINGFATTILRYTQERITVVVLANLEIAPVETIAHDLSAIAFGEEYSIPKRRTVADVPKELYDDYTGRYELRPNFIFAITREGDSLFVQPTGQGKSEIFPESETEFFSRIVDAQITFVRDELGNVTQLVLHQNGRDTPGRKIE